MEELDAVPTHAAPKSLAPCSSLREKRPHVNGIWDVRGPAKAVQGLGVGEAEGAV